MYSVILYSVHTCVYMYTIIHNHIRIHNVYYIYIYIYNIYVDIS